MMTRPKNYERKGHNKVPAAESKKKEPVIKLKNTPDEAKIRGTKISAQKSIPYLEMSPAGICRVKEHIYSKTVKFEDINYKLAKPEDQSSIFHSWCEFLNYFDSHVHVELSFVNRKSSMKEYADLIDIPEKDDKYNDLRKEYSEMLKNRLNEGNNGIIKSRYITFSIEADNVNDAAPRLKRIEQDIIHNLRAMSVKAEALNGSQRLKIMYEMFHPGCEVPFSFDYGRMNDSGLTTKDIIAPSSFTFSKRNTFQIGSSIGTATWLEILAPEVSDDMLGEFLGVDGDLTGCIHIQPVNQLEAVKMVKTKVTNIDSMKIDAQKQAVRSGYDMDIMPSDLNTFGKEAKQFLDDLQTRNEKMFLISILFVNIEKDETSLDTKMIQMEGIAQKYNCILNRLDYRQENGLMSVLPLGVDKTEVSRAVPTTAAGIFIPFNTMELFQPEQGLYYGLNAVSHNMILADRKKLKNPNGLILGTPGSGKSFAAKREISNAFFVTDDDIIVCDPEAEYWPLVNELGGQVIHLSANSKDYVNPMDINLEYDEDNPLGFKSDFILSLCELVLGTRNGIEAEEKSVIDRCLPIVYRKFFDDPRPCNMPVLEDLYNELMKQKEPQAHRIATALEIYVKGTLKVFNHRTNVELNNRIVCFDIKDLGKQLKKIGMLIVQDQVWNRVTKNRNESRSTRFYIDEFHLLLRDEQTAAYSVEIWKRFRKWGGIPTGITQNIKDLISENNREVENIFENSDFVLILNQRGDDKAILAEQYNISGKQLEYITNSEEGEGLLFYGSTIIPFSDHLSKDTKLYKLMTTKPEEIKARKAGRG